MSAYPSFRAFLDRLLTPRGYRIGKPGFWYKSIGNALLVVGAQAKRFEPGVYIEYGITYRDKHPPRDPKPSQCLIFGENPALNEAEFLRARDLLRAAVEICRNDSLQKEFEASIEKQLRCIEGWSDPAVLLKAIRRRRFRNMLYNGNDLGF